MSRASVLRRVPRALSWAVRCRAGRCAPHAWGTRTLRPDSVPGHPVCRQGLTGNLCGTGEAAGRAREPASCPARPPQAQTRALLLGAHQATARPAWGSSSDSSRFLEPRLRGPQTTRQISAAQRPSSDGVCFSATRRCPHGDREQRPTSQRNPHSEGVGTLAGV